VTGSAATSDVGPGWREIAAADFGRLNDRTFVRTAGGIWWSHDAGLLGVVATATSGADVAALVPAFRALRAHRAGRSVPDLDCVSDARRQRITPRDATVLQASYQHFMPLVRALARFVRRQAGILHDEWSAPYWSALNSTSQAPWQLGVFFDPAAAWSWLGLEPAVARDLDAFTASATSCPTRLPR